jgi:hypothetical protein
VAWNGTRFMTSFSSPIIEAGWIDKDLDAPTAQLGTAKCSNGSLGKLIRVNGTIPPGVKVHDTSTGPPYLVKQYDGYYVQHIPPKSPCSDGAALGQTIRAVNGEMRIP